MSQIVLLALLMINQSPLAAVKAITLNRGGNHFCDILKIILLKKPAVMLITCA